MGCMDHHSVGIRYGVFLRKPIYGSDVFTTILLFGVFAYHPYRQNPEWILVLNATCVQWYATRSKSARAREKGSKPGRMTRARRAKAKAMGKAMPTRRRMQQPQPQQQQAAFPIKRVMTRLASSAGFMQWMATPSQPRSPKNGKAGKADPGLGCPTCRYSSNGCRICRRPGYTPRGPNKKKHATD